MGMLRQSLEVEVLGMDAQMFEVKQRDEKLAFKVIQHVVCPGLISFFVLVLCILFVLFATRARS